MARQSRVDLPGTFYQVWSNDRVLASGREGLFKDKKGAVAGHYLSRDAGLSQREVAELLGVGTGAAVSAQVRRLEKLRKEERGLARKLVKIERRLEEARREGAGG